jgi:hypothetical protein
VYSDEDDWAVINYIISIKKLIANIPVKSHGEKVDGLPTFSSLNSIRSDFMRFNLKIR